MYCFIDFCCICFNDKNSLQHLFEADIDNITYFNKLTSCIPEMCFNEMNDRRLICKTCCENIEIVYKFRQKCLGSKTRLEDYISQLHKVSNIRGEINIHLTDLNKFDDVRKEYQNDNSKTELFKDVVNDTNEKGYSEIKSECSSINLKLTDARPNYIKFETVVIEMESENLNSEQNIEKMINDPLGNHNEINIDISRNAIELAASETKKEYQNQAVEEHLQESFDNIVETCDSENIDVDKKLEENFEHSIKLENCSEDFLLNLNEIKIDIIHNDIELMDSEINMQCKSEDIEEFSIEDIASSSKDQNVYNTDKYDIFLHKTMTYKPEIIVASTSKVQDIGNRKVATIKKQMHEYSVCPEKFSRASSITSHMGIHNEENPHECSICVKKFRCANSLKNHMRIHKGKKPYECNVCKKKFRQSNNLSTHMVVHTGEKSYECSICKKKFAYSSTLSTHMLIHTGEKPHECNICKKKFTRSDGLSKHMIVHTGEKLYECDICKKKFKHPHTLSKHKLIHTGKMAHKCNICKKKFAYSSHLFTHMLIHTEEKLFECDICKKKFRHSNSLSIHMFIHTGEKPYECNICKNKFTQSSNLSSHMLIHTGEKPYECNICKKKFKRSRNLSRHILIHTEEMEYECKICKKKFRRSYGLSNHMLVHIGESLFE